jgi:DNA polymerase I-like protein with 3'-5' exonuclease and polymerase domains
MAGAGFKRIAETLKIDLSLATRIAKAIDEAFPQVTAYTRELISFASQAPFGYNWAGRRYYLDKRFAYKFPNYRIQGGCAEVLRIAIRDIDALFLNVKVHEDTYMMMPIHDELTFNIHESDFYLIPQIKECMINAWKGKHLMMDVSVEWGSNLYDLEKYVGDSVQNARHEGLEIDVPKGVHPQDTGEITQGSTGHTCLH